MMRFVLALLAALLPSIAFCQALPSPQVQTRPANDNSTRAASTSYVDTGLATRAPLAGPALIGTPTVPTPTLGDNSTRIASSAFVQDSITAAAPYIPLSAAGCLPNGPTCGAEITAVVNAAIAAGKNIYIPPGHWRTSVPITLNYTASTAFFGGSVPRLNVFGAGSSVSVLTYTGSGLALVIKGGPTGSGQEAHHALSGFSLTGTNIADSVGLDLDHVAWFGLTDVHVTGFDKAINGIDVEYLRAVQSVIRFNMRGVTITSRANSGGTPDANSSDPNAHSWVASTISNNAEYGLSYVRPNSLYFGGTDIQYNGGSAPGRGRPGFGLKVLNAGTQGGIGVTIDAGYIEGNAGIADIWIRHDEPSFVGGQAIHGINAGFMRPHASPRTTNFIALDFAASTPDQSVQIASVFKNAGTATSTGPAIGFIGAKGKKDIYFSTAGSLFQTGEEVSDWADYTPTFSGSGGGSGFTATITGARFKRDAKTVTVQGEIVVKAVGTIAGSLIISLPVFVKAGLRPAAAVTLLPSGTATYGFAEGPSMFTTVPAVGSTLLWSITYDS